MTCRSKNCIKTSIGEFKYCEEHLCERHKRGSRCKNKKLMNTPFCFSHQFSNQGFNIFWILGIIIAIIIAIVTIFFGSKMYYFVYGDLIIDFKENDLIINEGVPSVKIELLNKLGSSLLFINATATLSCSDSFQKESQTFKLEGERDFLAHGSRSELLLSPDPFFVDLIETRDNPCPDANYQIAQYIKINESHAELENVYLFEFFVDNGFEIVKKDYSYPNKINTKSCLDCDVIINVSSSEKTFSKIENHKFVGSSTTIHPFNDSIKLPKKVSQRFLIGYFGSFSSFKPCDGLALEECALFVCKKIVEQYDIPIKCEEKISSSWIMSPLFTNKEMIPESFPFCE